MKNKTELFTIERIAKGFRNKDFKPSEILNLFLNNIKKNTKINAFIEVYDEVAMNQATKHDSDFVKSKELDFLTGIPVSLKDIFLVKDHKCTCGSKMLSNYISNYDSTVNTKLSSKGAIIIGKTNMDEFAMGSSTETSFFGPTLNPWDTSRGPWRV